MANAEKISLYDSLDDDVLTSYNEFALASLLYYAMKESACSEQSSRMTAMDSASKNAGKHKSRVDAATVRSHTNIICIVMQVKVFWQLLFGPADLLSGFFSHISFCQNVFYSFAPMIFKLH